MGIAFFLPPVGVGLSIAAGIARVDIDDVTRTYWPYLIALLVGLALVAAFPSSRSCCRGCWGYRDGRATQNPGFGVGIWRSAVGAGENTCR